MTSPDTRAWMRASERLRRALSGRKGRHQLEAMLDEIERLALLAGVEIGREASKPVRH